MRRLFITAILLFILPFMAMSQNPVADYLAAPDSLQLDCSFSYTVQGKVPVTGSGTVWMSGKSFKVRGNGLTVLCDGKSRWTVDEESREVYVESAEDMRDFLDNPSLLMSELKNASYGSGKLKGTYRYDGEDIALVFSSIRITQASDKKTFTPESEVKVYESEGFTVNDLR